MSGLGAWGWIGKTLRLFELPSSDDAARAPIGRARLRYSRSRGVLEGSLSGGPYEALAAAGLAVENMGELQLLPDESLPDGTDVSMSSLIDVWTLLKDSTDAADGITVLPTASGTGRWERRCIPSNHWRRQLDWWMDSVNGDDENVGDAANPIATFEEFRRRHGKLLGDPTAAPSPVTFTILDTGEVEQDFLVDMHVRAYPETFTIDGTTAVIYSGSVTAYVPWNVAGQQEPQLTDAALPVSWTASGLVHKQMILTSGAQIGATGYVSRDLGAKVAGMPLLLDAVGFSMVEPAVGNTFDVFQQTTIKGHLYIDIGNGFLYINNIEFDNSDAMFADDLTLQTGFAFLRRCALVGTNTNRVSVESGQLDLFGGLVANNGITIRDGLLYLDGPLVSAGTFYWGRSARVRISLESLFDGSGRLDGNGDFHVSADTAFINCGAVIPFIGNPGALIQASAVLWGTTGNTPTYAFSLGNMATIAADVANLKIMGGTVNDILLGSAGAAYGAARPMVDANSEAKVLDRYDP